MVSITVKLGNKERFDKEQTGIKELFMDYQPFYTINLLLDKELYLRYTLYSTLVQCLQYETFGIKEQF